MRRIQYQHLHKTQNKQEKKNKGKKKKKKCVGSGERCVKRSRKLIHHVHYTIQGGRGGKVRRARRDASPISRFAVSSSAHGGHRFALSFSSLRKETFYNRHAKQTKNKRTQNRPFWNLSAIYSSCYANYRSPPLFGHAHWACIGHERSVSVRWRLRSNRTVRAQWIDGWMLTAVPFMTGGSLRHLAREMVIANVGWGSLKKF